MKPLEVEIRNIIAEYHGDVGVAIEHIESGRRLTINGETRFPLASVYKIPIMVEVFRQAAEGKLSLAERITLQPELYHPWGRIVSRFDYGLRLTLRGLAYWMMVVSDNLAADILLDKVGIVKRPGHAQGVGINRDRCRSAGEAALARLVPRPSRRILL